MRCNVDLRKANQPCPRTCAECQLGPCKKYVRPREPKGVCWANRCERFGHPVYDEGGELVALILESDTDNQTALRKLIDILQAELNAPRETPRFIPRPGPFETAEESEVEP